MPPRNNPLPAAVRLFNCTICDKGYPRQLDYENHLRSYDHNHRQRLADMKKLTASNDTESSRPKQGLELRSIDVEAGKGKMGKGFTKIGGGAVAGVGGGSRFKKVGVAVGEKKVEKEVDAAKVVDNQAAAAAAAVVVVPEKLAEAKTNDNDNSKNNITKEDVVMAQEEADEQEDITWEEYDFTKPTACQQAPCPGLKTDGIWTGEWVSV